MKIKHRIISAISAASAAFSLMSATGFAQNLKYDVNGDGFVNSIDALYVLKECVKSNTDPALDANGDGFVNVNDALLILKYTVGLIKDDAPEAPAKQNGESILDNYEVKWTYNTLTDKQKKAYKALCNGILECEAKIDLSDCGITKSDYDKTFAAMRADNPHLISTNGAASYMLSSDNTISYFKYSYNLTAAQCKSTMNTIEKTTADVIEEAKTLSSDYEKAELFHDWIINRTDYIANGEKYTWRMDGPIIYRKSVCEGYSKAFSYLCQSVGIECICISGTGNGGPHMWNMVKIDGEWYHADVTWDDPISWDGSAILRYDYFLISESDIKQDHTINSEIKRPTAAYAYGE